MNQAQTSGSFLSNLPPAMSIGDDRIELRLLKEYGAMFVARGGVKPPSKIVFRDQDEVSAFQAELETSAETIGSFPMELQTRAMNELRDAIDDAAKQGLSITPRGSDSAKRSYDETVELWNSRVEPALKHWVEQGRLKQEDADGIAGMSPFEQVSVVLRLEEDGIYFAKDLSKSILYSVAPPGTSQHLAMLALDVNEFDNRQVRAILAGHGWHQTVTSDLPHFTYLGAAEGELPGLGLKRIVSGDRYFFVPDI